MNWDKIKEERWKWISIVASALFVLYIIGSMQADMDALKVDLLKQELELAKCMAG